MNIIENTKEEQTEGYQKRDYTHNKLYYTFIKESKAYVE